jgi:hypothetical protein
MAFDERVRRRPVADRVEQRSGRVADADRAARRSESLREALVRLPGAFVAAAAEQVEAAGRDRRSGRNRRQRHV